MKTPTKTTVGVVIDVFSTVLETATGGFNLDNTNLADDVVVPAGSPIAFDESTRVAKVLKTAIVYEDAGNTATALKIKKGHLLKTGEIVGAVIGGKAYAGTLDTSNADYDVFTVATTLGVALTAGDVLFQSSASGASAAAFFGGTLKGLLYDDVIMADGVSCSVVLRGTVLARRVPGLSHSSIKTALPLIIFSQSY